MPVPDPTPAGDCEAGEPCRCDSWTVSKLNASFCATDVDLFGSTHVHAVSDTGGVRISNGSTALQLRSKDAAIISLEYKTAFPDPVHKILDVGTVAQSAYVNLQNNFWTTNCECITS